MIPKTLSPRKLSRLVAHGRSVFHIAQELGRFARSIGELAERRSDFFISGDSQQAYGCIAESGEVVGSVADLLLTLIFGEWHVADPVQTFDALPVGDEQGGVGAEVGEARESAAAMTADSPSR